MTRDNKQERDNYYFSVRRKYMRVVINKVCNFLIKRHTFFSRLKRRENPRINIIVVDLVMVTLGRNSTVYNK